MTIQIDLDLSDAYNRIADTWYPVFVSNRQQSMPVAACAYPVNMGEHMIAAIRDDVLPEDYYLRWQMSIAAADQPARGDYQLYCNWQGRTLQQDNERYLFIDNAVGWVDWLGDEGAGSLDVQVAFGHPFFDNNVATMTVDFYVSEIDGGGTAVRDVHRPFQIHADGRREMLF